MTKEEYIKQVDEYLESAEKIKAIIEKYQKQLKSSKVNREAINGTIAYYYELRRELLITAKHLKAIASKIK